MGRLFFQDLEGKTFNCKFCKTKLARADQLITKALHCRSGRAYLINKVSDFVNEEEEVNLNTMGEHKSSSKKNSSRMKRLNVSSKIRKRKSRRNKSKRLSSSKDDLSSPASFYYSSSPLFLSSDS